MCCFGEAVAWELVLSIEMVWICNNSFSNLSSLVELNPRINVTLRLFRARSNLKNNWYLCFYWIVQMKMLKFTKCDIFYLQNSNFKVGMPERIVSNVKFKIIQSFTTDYLNRLDI